MTLLTSGFQCYEKVKLVVWCTFSYALQSLKYRDELAGKHCPQLERENSSHEVFVSFN
jgi:hypothetical protein